MKNFAVNQKSSLKAFALEYKNTESLPQVLASGEDELARLILAIAEHSEIPIEENKELAALLQNQNRGPIVSPKALKVLAEVIAFLYHTDASIKKQKQAA